MSRGVWTTHEEAAAEDRAYWNTRGIEERVAAVELIRRATTQTATDPSERMARVFEFVDRPPRTLQLGRKA